MKRLLLSFALLAAFCASALASTPLFLAVYGTTTQSVALQKVKRITFEATSLVVTLADGSQLTTPLSALTHLDFIDETSSVRSAEAATSALLLQQGGRLVAAGTGLLSVYDMSGHLVRQMHVRTPHSSLSLTDLPRGIYVATLGTSAIKIAR